MLAQKVETRQEFVTAKKNGFTEFQGYFFRHTDHLRARQIPASQATYVRLLQAISKSNVDFAEIEDLIKREPALSYRLLRYLNSPLLGVSTAVLSIRHALNLLGEREVVRWIRMATTMVMGQEKSSDLVLSSLVRARFCELISPKVKHGQSDLYLMGLLSLMDAILEVPIGVIIDSLPMDPETKQQLLCGKNGAKQPSLHLRSDGCARGRRLGASDQAGERIKLVRVLDGRDLQRSHVLGPPSYWGQLGRSSRGAMIIPPHQR